MTTRQKLSIWLVFICVGLPALIPIVWALLSGGMFGNVSAYAPPIEFANLPITAANGTTYSVLNTDSECAVSGTQTIQCWYNATLGKWLPVGRLIPVTTPTYSFENLPSDSSVGTEYIVTGTSSSCRGAGSTTTRCWFDPGELWSSAVGTNLQTSCEIGTTCGWTDLSLSTKPLITAPISGETGPTYNGPIRREGDESGNFVTEFSNSDGTPLLRHPPIIYPGMSIEQRAVLGNPPSAIIVKEQSVTESNGIGITYVERYKSPNGIVIFQPTGANNEGPRFGDPGTRPTCDNTTVAADPTLRGMVFFDQGGAGVADTFAICAKDASNNYAWRALIN